MDGHGRSSGGEATVTWLTRSTAGTRGAGRQTGEVEVGGRRYELGRDAVEMKSARTSLELRWKPVVA